MEEEAAGIGEMEGEMGPEEIVVVGERGGGEVEWGGEGVRQCRWKTSLPSPTNSDSVK
jgi:hypothetical protein